MNGTAEINEINKHVGNHCNGNSYGIPTGATMKIHASVMTGGRSN